MNQRPTVRVSPPSPSLGRIRRARLVIVNNQQDFVYNTEAEPTEGEARIERESSAGSGLRLIQPPQLCQCSGKIEMREGQIALGIDDAPAQPYDRFRVST